MRNTINSTPPHKKLHTTTEYNGGCSVEEEYGAAIATGNYGVAVANGNKTIALVTGVLGAATAMKPESLAFGFGTQSKVKGVLGSHIAVMYTDHEGMHILVKKVDGVSIKADTWYSIQNGQFRETE